MKPGKRVEHNGVVRRLTTMIDQAVGIIRWIAQPSLTQLMLRLALAAPSNPETRQNLMRTVSKYRVHLNAPLSPGPVANPVFVVTLIICAACPLGKPTVKPTGLG
jgi:hypothetical protein